MNLMNVLKLTDPTVRFHDQFCYGNREIILDYLSIPRNYIILGNIQAGFSPYSWSPKKIRLSNGKLARHYLWSLSDTFADRGDIFAIGATWLYFLEMKYKEKSWAEKERARKLQLPDQPKVIGYIPAKFGNSLNTNSLMHARNAEFLRHRLGAETEIKVLLDTRDMLSNDTRQAYENLGIQPYCNGWNGSLLINGGFGDEKLRTNFYQEMFEFLKSVDCVISESFGSHLLYSLSVGVPIRVLQRKKTTDLLTSEFKQMHSDYVQFKLNYEKIAEFHFPKLFDGEKRDQTNWQSAAFQILGIDYYFKVRNHLEEILLLKQIRRYHFVSHTKAVKTHE